MLTAVYCSPRRQLGLWASCALLLFAASDARAQYALDPEPGELIFTVFVRSVPIGVERVGVARTDDGWLVTSTGQSGRPIDLDIRSFEAEYDEQWQPRRLTIDSVRQNRIYAIETTFADGVATNAIQQGDKIEKMVIAAE